jgi:hypothetical protein
MIKKKSKQQNDKSKISNSVANTVLKMPMKDKYC